MAAYIKLRVMTEGVDAAILGMKKLALAVTGVATAALSFTAIVKGFKDVIDLSSKMHNMAVATGATEKQLVILGQALEDIGRSGDEAGAVINKLQKQLYEAAQNSNSLANNAVKNLNLSLEDLVNMDPAAQFEAISKAFAGMEDPMKRAKVASDLFGKSGAEYIPLFVNGFEDAKKNIGPLAELIQRNAEQWDRIGTILGRVKNISLGFFAGILDQLTDRVLPAFEKLNEMDFSKFGQKFGAIIDVAMDEWEKGHLVEFIEKGMSGAFEIGSKKAMNLLKTVISGFFENNLDKILLNGLLTAATGMAKGWNYVIGGAVYILLRFEEALKQRVGMWGVIIIDVLQALLNKLLAFKGKYPEIAQLLGLGTVETVLTGTALAGLQAVKNELKNLLPALGDGSEHWQAVFGEGGTVQQANEELTHSLEILRNEFHLTVGDMSTASKDMDEWWAMIEAKMRERNAKAAAADAARNKGQGPRPHVQIFDLQAETEAAHTRLGNKEQELARLRANWTLTEQERYRATSKALIEQSVILDEIIAKLREKYELEQDAEKKKAIGDAIKGFETDQEQLRTAQLGMGPSPDSFGDQMYTSINKVVEQIGTIQEQIARGFTEVIGGAIDGIAGGIEGLLNLTMTWSQALRHIGTSVMNTIIKSISKMFAEWIVGRAMASAKEIFFTGQEIGVKSISAMLSSISSWGWAAIAGGAAFIAAMALVGGFEKGGYTGDGDRKQVAGVVHKGEWVLSKDQVDAIGVDRLNTMFSGDARTPKVSVNTAAPAVSTDIRIAAFDNRLDARQWANSVDAEAWFVDMSRKTMHQWART